MYVLGKGGENRAQVEELVLYAQENGGQYGEARLLHGEWIDGRARGSQEAVEFVDRAVSFDARPVLGGRLATCAAVAYRRRTAANAAVGRLTIGRSLPSCPTTWLNSLAPRDGPFQSGDEVQFRRGVSEHLLVLAVERIAQVAVSGHAAAKGVIQVDAHVGESGIPE